MKYMNWARLNHQTKGDLRLGHRCGLLAPGIVSLCLMCSESIGADWPQFRGPGGTALAEGAAARDSFKVTWEASLPGKGLSSPIVVGERLFVTAASGPDQGRLHVLCFAVKDGTRLWERTFRATGRTMTHEKTSVAAPTACSDGQRIFALFSSNDVIALDLDGNLQWLRGLTLDYVNASNSLGMASSPLILDETLVVQIENDSESLAVGLAADTGINRWIKERPKAANWTSAVTINGAVALQSSRGLLGVEPKTGRELWNYSDGASTTTSSVVSGDVIYAPSHGITALSAAEGTTSQLWRAENLGPGTASPVVLGDHIFVVNKSGVLVKGRLTDGEEIWKLRLKGPFSGSPIAWGDRLFITSERGDLQVIDPSGSQEGKIVHTVALGETVLSTPAVADGALFVRGATKLWRLE